MTYYLFPNAHLLIRDLEPCLSNVSRRVCKDSDGVEALSKGVRLTLEDIDQAITAVQAKCTFYSQWYCQAIRQAHLALANLLYWAGF